MVIGAPIRKQLKMLREKIPSVFQQREMDDLGCGDGKITLILKDIFKPQKLRGFDVNPALVKRSRDKGIEAEVRNLDSGLPTGELAVMWGVLHHLNDVESCIKRIQANYPMAFIREPIKHAPVKLFEMGEPLVKENIEQLVETYLPNSRTFYYDNCIFIFYASSGYLKP